MSISERPPEEATGEPPILSPGSFSNSPYWLIVRDRMEPGAPGGSGRRGSGGLEVLSLHATNGKALPVFGSEESCSLFARALSQAGRRTNDVGGEWRARGTGAGELISLLSASAYSTGACANLETIAFDPPPAIAEDVRQRSTIVDTRDLITTSRRCFLESLMGRGRPWFETRVLEDTE